MPLTHPMPASDVREFKAISETYDSDVIKLERCILDALNLWRGRAEEDEAESLTIKLCLLGEQMTKGIRTLPLQPEGVILMAVTARVGLNGEMPIEEFIAGLFKAETAEEFCGLLAE